MKGYQLTSQTMTLGKTELRLPSGATEVDCVLAKPEDLPTAVPRDTLYETLEDANTALQAAHAELRKQIDDLKTRLVDQDDINTNSPAPSPKPAPAAPVEDEPIDPAPAAPPPPDEPGPEPIRDVEPTEPASEPQPELDPKAGEPTPAEPVEKPFNPLKSLFNK